MFRHLSRKRLDTKTTGSFTSLLTRQDDSVTEAAAKRSCGCVAPDQEGAPKAVYFSAASVLAHDPATDLHVLQVDSKHLFAAVLTFKTRARGGHYLRQHIHMELLAQIKQHGGDVPKAIQGAITHLNNAFKNLHPANPELLEGVQLALAYADFATQKLYLASNGECRCVVGRSTVQGDVKLAANFGPQGEDRPGSKTNFPPEDVTVLNLDGNIETIVLGSAGLWQELPPSKALLRLEHFFEAAPRANQGSAAAHLTNFALHNVTRRVRGAADLRMRSLKSVSNLLSLHTGEKSQFKWGNRQPVRRRRGDVHGDLTAVTFRLDWEGKQCSFKEQSKRSRPALVEQPQHAQREYSHWDLVRLHFKDFARQSRQLTQRQWQDLAHQILQQQRQTGLKPALEAAEKDGSLQKRSVLVTATASFKYQPGSPLKAEE